MSCHGGSERIVRKVTSNSDSGRVDHSVLIGREVRALKLSIVHVGDVLVSGGMVVILLDYLVEKRSKGIKALVTSCVNTDSRIGPFATGEDALLEGKSIFIRLVLALLPNITCENF